MDWRIDPPREDDVKRKYKYKIWIIQNTTSQDKDVKGEKPKQQFSGKKEYL